MRRGFKFDIKININFKNMAEKLRSEVEKVQELRSKLEIFWRNVLGEYFEQHHEYPPFVDQDKVSQFIQMVSNRDSRFRQSVEQFRSIQGDLVRVAMEVYNDLSEKAK